MDDLKFGGRFLIECHDKDGNLKWREDGKNIVVNTGIQHIEDSGLIGTTWYIGLLGNVSPVATTVIGDVAGSEVQNYDEANRVTWSKSRSAQTVTNTASPAAFTISASVTVYGAFITNQAGKGSTGGILLAAKQFGASRALVDDDVLSVTYEITGTSSS